MWKATRRSTGRYPSGKGPPKGSRGRPESPLVASAEAKSFAIRGRIGRPLSCLPQGNRFIYKFLLAAKGPKVSKGRSESPLVASAEAKSFAIRGRIGRPFSCLPQGNRFIYKFLLAAKGPKVSKGRSESPLVASAEAKSSMKQEKESKAFSLPFTRNLLLVRGFTRLRADEVLSYTGKYPKGAGGGQRVHVSWPPPELPVAKLQCTASLAGAQDPARGSHPSLGGPLSPSAQLIPPPAPRHRIILGV